MSSGKSVELKLEKNLVELKLEKNLNENIEKKVEVMQNPPSDEIGQESREISSQLIESKDQLFDIETPQEINLSEQKLEEFNFPSFLQSSNASQDLYNYDLVKKSLIKIKGQNQHLFEGLLSEASTLSKEYFTYLLQEFPSSPRFRIIIDAIITDPELREINLSKTQFVRTLCKYATDVISENIDNPDNYMRSYYVSFLKKIMIRESLDDSTKFQDFFGITKILSAESSAFGLINKRVIEENNFIHAYQSKLIETKYDESEYKGEIVALFERNKDKYFYKDIFSVSPYYPQRIIADYNNSLTKKIVQPFLDTVLENKNININSNGFVSFLFKEACNKEQPITSIAANAKEIIKKMIVARNLAWGDIRKLLSFGEEASLIKIYQDTFEEISKSISSKKTPEPESKSESLSLEGGGTPSLIIGGPSPSIKPTLNAGKERTTSQKRSFSIKRPSVFGGIKAQHDQAVSKSKQILPADVYGDFVEKFLTLTANKAEQLSASSSGVQGIKATEIIDEWKNIEEQLQEIKKQLQEEGFVEQFNNFVNSPEKPKVFIDIVSFVAMLNNPLGNRIFDMLMDAGIEYPSSLLSKILPKDIHSLSANPYVLDRIVRDSNYKKDVTILNPKGKGSGIGDQESILTSEQKLIFTNLSEYRKEDRRRINRYFGKSRDHVVSLKNLVNFLDKEVSNCGIGNHRNVLLGEILEEISDKEVAGLAEIFSSYYEGREFKMADSAKMIDPSSAKSSAKKIYKLMDYQNLFNSDIFNKEKGKLVSPISIALNKFYQAIDNKKPLLAEEWKKIATVIAKQMLDIDPSLAKCDFAQILQGYKIKQDHSKAALSAKGKSEEEIRSILIKTPAQKVIDLTISIQNNSKDSEIKLPKSFKEFESFVSYLQPRQDTSVGNVGLFSNFLGGLVVGEAKEGKEIKVNLDSIKKLHDAFTINKNEDASDKEPPKSVQSPKEELQAKVKQRAEVVSNDSTALAKIFNKQNLFSAEPSLLEISFNNYMKLAKLETIKRLGRDKSAVLTEANMLDPEFILALCKLNEDKPFESVVPLCYAFDIFKNIYAGMAKLDTVKAEEILRPLLTKQACSEKNIQAFVRLFNEFAASKEFTSSKFYHSLDINLSKPKLGDFTSKKSVAEVKEEKSKGKIISSPTVAHSKVSTSQVKSELDKEEGGLQEFKISREGVSILPESRSGSKHPPYLPSAPISLPSKPATPSFVLGGTPSLFPPIGPTLGIGSSDKHEPISSSISSQSISQNNNRGSALPEISPAKVGMGAASSHAAAEVARRADKFEGISK